MLDQKHWRDNGIAGLFSIVALSITLAPASAQDLHTLGSAAPEASIILAEEDEEIRSADVTKEIEIIPISGALHPDLATDSTEPVGIIFGFGLDISMSIEAEEYQAQLDALANTIERPDFRESIFAIGGPGSAAIFVGDFSYSSTIVLPAIDFRENDPEKFQQVADLIRALPRGKKGGTNTYSFLKNAARMFETLPWESNNTHTIVVTDGAGTQEEKIHDYVELLARKYQSSVSAFVTRTKDSSDNYDWALEHLTTPADTYRLPNGDFLQGGITKEIATEVETQGSNIARYQDMFFLATRQLITMQSASLNLDIPDIMQHTPKTRYAAITTLHENCLSLT